MTPRVVAQEALSLREATRHRGAQGLAAPGVELAPPTSRQVSPRLIRCGVERAPPPPVSFWARLVVYLERKEKDVLRDVERALS